MGQCKAHHWVLVNVSGKTWVKCEKCTAQFLFGPEYSGTRYLGEVPEKYRNDAAKE